MKQHNLPPADQIIHPGPGVDGPGPGVLMPQQHPVAMMMPQAGGPAGSSIQVIFNKPDGMRIDLDTHGNGSALYTGENNSDRYHNVHRASWREFEVVSNRYYNS